MADWPGLKKLIDRHDVAGVAALVRGMGAEQRRALAGPLKEYERQLRRDFQWGPQSPLAVAGAAVLPGPSALAPWLARNASWWDGPDEQRRETVSAVLDVLHDRGVPWLPDLARLLAERLPRGRDAGGLWLLVSALVSQTGIEPPLTDGYVIQWAADHPWGAGVVGKIRCDPRLAILVPRLFEIDQVAGQFQPVDGLGEGWPAALAALAAGGVVERVVLIDSCLAGLQRSGRLGALRGLLAVHDELALDLAEIAAHARDYLALLPAAHSTVAGAAQRQLRRADEAGKLDPAVLREASQAVLLRPEKILVRAQLDWLAKAAARDPGRASELALMAATAFSHEAADLQAQALRAVLRLLAGLDAGAMAGLAAAAAALPPDLRGQAATAFGPVRSADETVIPMLAVPASAGMPPPVGSAEELAAELGALYAGETDQVDPVSLERVLAGLVAFSHADRPALAAALQPLLARQEWIRPGSPHRQLDYQTALSGELDLIIGAAVVPADRSGGLSYPRTWSPGELPGPHAALKTRMHEVAVGVWQAPRPLLVSTPSTSTGLIDPGELLGRLRRAADEGWEPWPADLAQALLRLPRDPDRAIAAKAAGLGTPAGTALARRLSAGVSDPDVTAAERTFRRQSTVSSPMVTQVIGQVPATVTESFVTHHVTITETAERLMLATVRSAAGPGDASDPCEFVGELTEPERWITYGHPAVMVNYETSWLSCWPMVLPANRDVIAAYLVPYMHMTIRDGRGGGAAMAGLAAAEGPVGAGMHLALGYGLGAHDQADRSAAADALITLAARGQLDGETFGKKLGFQVAWEQPLRRVVPGLRELARAGAQAEVWSVVAAALPLILPPALSQPPQQAGELIALGVEVAQAVRPAGVTLPGIGELAARRGSSQLIVQARRLRDTLAARP